MTKKNLLSKTMTSVIYTMFYDRPPAGSKTRVTSRPFILATSPNQTYLPPASWPARRLPPTATAALVSPINIDAPSAKARQITTDKLDLTNLKQPAHNPIASVNSMKFFTINENPTNTIKLNGKTYRQNSTYFLKPGSHGIRINSTDTQARDAEYVIIFTEERDWTDKIAISVFVISQPTATNPPSNSQRYFEAIQTTQTTNSGVPLGDLFQDIKRSGAYTYHGSTFLPENTTGLVLPMVWYIFEMPVTIAASDLARIWSVADASGNLFVGPQTPAIATIANTYYLPASQIIHPRNNTAPIETRECRIVQTRQYYDSSTGQLRAVREGDRFVPIRSIVEPPAIQTNTQQTKTEESSMDQRTIETLVAILIGLILAITIVVYFAKRQGLIRAGPSLATIPLSGIAKTNT